MPDPAALIELLLRSTVVVGVFCLVWTFAPRPTHPTRRHEILAGMMAGLLLALGVAATGHRIDVAIPSSEPPPLPASRPSAAAAILGAATGPAPTLAPPSRAGESRVPHELDEVTLASEPPAVRALSADPAAAGRRASGEPEARQAPFGDPATWALAIWAIGGAILLVWFSLGAVELVGLSRRSIRVADPGWRSELAACTESLGLPRAPRLSWSSEVAVPLAWGFGRGRILIPEDAMSWTPDRRRAVLLHELAHLRRRDTAWTWLGELVRAAYWPNAFVWWLLGRLRQESEEACDAAVVGAGIHPAAYARDLLELTHGERRGTPARAAMALGPARGFQRRLEALLSGDGPGHSGGSPVPRAPALAVGVLTTALALSAWAHTVPDERASRTARLLAALGHGDAEARERAAWGLGELESRAAVPALVERLHDAEPSVRVMAAWALGEIKDPAAVGPLLEALGEPDPLVLEMVVRAIGEIEDPRAVPPLAPLALEARSSDGLRSAAVWALGEIGSPGARATVREVLAAGSGEARLAAVEALSGSREREDLAALASRLDDPDPELRARVTHALGHPAGTSFARARLIEALTDADPEVRRASAEAWGRARDPAAVAPLIRRLRDPDVRVRIAATWALDEIQSE